MFVIYVNNMLQIHNNASIIFQNNILKNKIFTFGFTFKPPFTDHDGGHIEKYRKQVLFSVDPGSNLDLSWTLTCQFSMLLSKLQSVIFNFFVYYLRKCQLLVLPTVTCAISNNTGSRYYFQSQVIFYAFIKIVICYFISSPGVAYENASQFANENERYLE